MNKKKLQRVAATGGIVWGLTMFLTTVLSVYTGYAQPFLNAMASIYPGYTISMEGSVIGMVYGFFDVFLCIYIIAYVYDKLNLR